MGTKAWVSSRCRSSFVNPSPWYGVRRYEIFARPPRQSTDHPSVPFSPRKSGAVGRSPMICPNERKAASVSGSTTMRVTVPGATAASASRALGRVRGDPVPRDVHAPADPDAVVLEHVIEEALEAGRAAG